MILTIDIDYGIGNPPRRARTRTLAINYQVLPPVPPRVLVKVGGSLSARSMLIFVDDILS